MSNYAIAIIGCGNIAGPYVDDLKTYDEIELLGVADVDADRARSFATDHGTSAYDSVDALVADERVQIVVNLTSHFAHKEISEKCLQAGKHVYSEKPLATTPEDAHFLVELAQSKGLRLACSPFTLLGEAQQTAWKLIRDGKLGKVRVAFAEVNWGRIESWHPAPGPFYQVGALYDVGVYPLTLLTAYFGPVKRVTAYGTMLKADRVTKEGTPFHITTPDFAVSMLETEGGAVIRLTTDFYVSGHTSRQTGVEFHGDDGSLFMESWFNPHSPLFYGDFGQPMTEVPLLRPANEGIRWGQGIYELVQAIRDGRPHRFSGEHAAHITDILAASARSMTENTPVEVTSTFAPPPPMEWVDQAAGTSIA